MQTTKCTSLSILTDKKADMSQARIQLLAKGQVVKIMGNNVLLPQAANVSDRMPRKRVPQTARMIFSGYTIDSECTSWESTGGICKPASWGGAPGSNHILSNIMASKESKIERPTELTRTS